jgi:hypothetical protein
LFVASGLRYLRVERATVAPQCFMPEAEASGGCNMAAAEVSIKALMRNSVKIAP